VSDPAKIVFSVDEKGLGPISLNGMPLGNHVRAFEVISRAGDATVVLLELINVTVSGEATAEEVDGLAQS
jgi:hypothetical protein